MDKKFGQFRVGDLFDIHPTSAYKMTNKKLYQTKGNTPVLSNSSLNNGIGGYVGLEPTEEGNIITFSDTTTGPDTIFYQDKPFIGYAHVQGMYPFNPENWNEKRYIYFISAIKCSAGKGWNYANKFNRKLVAELQVYLPLVDGTKDQIDWNYMEKSIIKFEQERIKELEQERIKEIDAYLKAAELDDYELTKEEKENLLLYTNLEDKENKCKNEIVFKKFKLGDIFKIYSPKKKFNANAIKFNGKYPYVARGSSNNGIKGYISEDIKYLCPANTLSFGQDTATVFYQEKPYFTGDKIKIMELKCHKLTPLIASFLISNISKAFSKFVWGQNSFNEDIIKAMEIELPVINGSKDEINFDYMESYITAIEKQVITDIINHKDSVIEVTKQVSSSYICSTKEI